MPFPTTEDLPLTVRMAFGADLTADPASWSFTDMSDRLVNTPIAITKGRPAGGQPTASTCDLDLENTDGELSPDNAESTLWPDVDLDVPIEVLAGSSNSGRFEGFASVLRPDFVPTTDGTPLSVLHVSAAGILQRLTQASQSKTLGSPLRRSMAGIAPGDYQPHAYWPMEDGPEATSFASGLPNGTPATFTGAVSPGANADDLAGSLPLPTLGTGSTVTFPIASYTNTNQWVLQFCLDVPAALAAETTLFTILSPGGTIVRWEVSLLPNLVFPPALDYRVRGFNSAGTALIDNTKVAENDTESFDFYGNWVMAGLMVYQSGGNVACRLNMASPTRPATGVVATTAGTHSAIASLRVPALGSSLNGVGLGHVGLFTDPNFTIAVDDVANAAAMDGYNGETTVDRWNRVLTEERIRHGVTGTSTTTMGPQPVDVSVLDLMTQIEVAEQGAVTEKDWGVNLVCASARYNLAVGLTIDLSTYRTDAGAARQVLAPNYSFQGYRNQWTVKRPDGSSAIARASEAEIARRNLYDEEIEANLGGDTDLAQHASWRLNRDLLNRVRYPDTPVDVGENTVVDASFIDDWFALEVGVARVQRTNVPGLHGAGAIDQLLEGYTERLERRRLRVGYNASPYEPYLVGKWDDTTSARLDTAGSVLHTAVNSSATSFDVATTSGPLWTTDNAEDGWDWWVGGERVTVTDVAASTITYGAVGTVSHGNSASVTPGLPGSLAQGNLMVMLAAIRNSGTGVPDTPSGWTRWPVFRSTDNVQVFAKIAGASESGPTVTFTGGAANADTTAQIIRLAGKWHDAGFALLSKANCLNASAQDIVYPGLSKPKADDCLILYVGWKADDWTSVASPGTEIAEPDTTTGDDQGIVWAYEIQTSRTAVAAGSFVVTGGAAAISRGAVMAIRCDYQTATVTRSVNGVTKSHSADAEVRLWRAMRLAL